MNPVLEEILRTDRTTDADGVPRPLIGPMSAAEGELIMRVFDSVIRHLCVRIDEDLAKAERAKVRRALSSLPEAQRVTLEVAFFEGLSYPEIAARDNVPLGTIKSRAARAIASLREALVKEGS